MSKSDFLSWDDDIDLDVLLGDYSEDDDNDVQHKKPKKDPPSDAGFRCPVCSRVPVSVGMSPNNMKNPISKANNTAENPISKTTSTDLHTFIADIFPAIFEATLKSIAKDPMHKLFGESEVTLLSRVVLCLSGVHQFFLDTFMTVFSVGRTLCSTLDREYMFQKYHQTTVSADFTCGYMLLFGTLTFTSQGICNFVNILLMELMGNLIKERAESALKKAASEHETISDSDQNILFYVCGFIARSLKKRYSRSKSACPKKKKCLEKLVLKSPNSTFISRFSNWMSKNDRGGLLYPCDDSFLLVREFEMSIRKHVNLQNLSAKTLLCDNLKEHVLESFMVKHYCDKLFGDIDGDMDIVQSTILEDILCLFLTVRGYAITRVKRNELAKDSQPKKKSSGLRHSLKALTANLNS